MCSDDFDTFLRWEVTTHDTIDFKKVYVDIAGDLVAGLMLSQIVFWHLPNTRGEQKLRVFRDDHYWMVKSREEWWDECRLTKYQVDRAIKQLVERGLIEKRNFRFNNAPTSHIRLIKDHFIAAWQAVTAQAEDAPNSDNPEFRESRNSDFGDSRNSGNSNMDIRQNRKSEVRESRKSITETTQRLPAETTKIPAAGADAAADPPETPPATVPVTEAGPAEPPAEDPPPDDAPAPSTSESKRKAQNGRTRTEQDDMFDAVAWVLYGAKTPEDIAVLSKGARTNTGKAAKRLRDYGAGTGDLREWWGWWCEFDWRGKQRQRPTSSQLTDSWPQFTAWREDPEARASPDGQRVGGRGASDDEYVIERREDQRIDLRDYVQRES